jgi:hypothetical protein
VDVLEQFAGATLIFGGLLLFSPPIAVIVLGLMFAIHGFLRELKSIREKEMIDARSREPSAFNDPTRDS